MLDGVETIALMVCLTKCLVPNLFEALFSPAICINACINGTCSAPNTCTCTSGFSGALCDVGLSSHVLIGLHRIDSHFIVSAICLAGCRQGTCDGKPNTCSCNPGWEGTLCDQPICQPRCVQGFCVESTQYNKSSLMFVHRCTCNQGWTGATCSTRS
jgi:hypothetical protein